MRGGQGAIQKAEGRGKGCRTGLASFSTLLGTQRRAGGRFVYFVADISEIATGGLQAGVTACCCVPLLPLGERACGVGGGSPWEGQEVELQGAPQSRGKGAVSTGAPALPATSAKQGAVGSPELWACGCLARGARRGDPQERSSGWQSDLVEARSPPSPSPALSPVKPTLRLGISKGHPVAGWNKSMYAVLDIFFLPNK